MKKLRGRNPTVNERKILESSDVNPDNWLIHKIKMVPVSDEQTKSSLSKYQDKIQHWILVNREDGRTKTIQLDVE